MLHPTPRSTLFPYTTLFRSYQLQMKMESRQILFLRNPCGLGAPGKPRERPKPDEATEFFLDRKSTRLNSSHRCISYAVFCLKKKIKNVFYGWIRILIYDIQI